MSTKRMNTPEEVSERVARGCMFLDEKYGDGWWNRVDMDTLNMKDAHRCVLTQVMDDGSWPWSERIVNAFDTSAAKNAVKVAEDEAIARGFTITSFDDSVTIMTGIRKEFMQLEWEWRKVLRTLQPKPTLRQRLATPFKRLYRKVLG